MKIHEMTYLITYFRLDTSKAIVIWYNVCESPLLYRSKLKLNHHLFFFLLKETHFRIQDTAVDFWKLPGSTCGKVHPVGRNWAMAATETWSYPLHRKVHKNIHPSSGYWNVVVTSSLHKITHSIPHICILSMFFFIISWARILFKPMDSLQWSLLPPSAFFTNMVRCTEGVPQRARGLGQHPQCGGPKLCHLSTWIW